MSEPPDEGRLQRVHPLSPLLRGGIVLVALVLAAGRQLLEGGGSLDWPLWVVLPVVLAVFGWGLLSWWFTWFRLGTATLRMETGILVRRSRRIRLDRVQAVEVQQPFLARLFGMAELQIETAGGDTEASLAFLSHADALALRSELLERAGGVSRTGEAAAGADGQRAPDEVLHRVSPGLLLVSQLFRSGVLLAVVGSAVGLAVSAALGQPLGLALLVPLGIGLANGVGNGFVAQYDFMLTRTPRGLGVRAGLFGVRSQSVPIDRVQGVVVVEPVVWRWLGWCEVRVTVAGVRSRGEDEARYTSTLVPVIDRDAGARLAIEALGSGGPEATTLHTAPRRARWLEPVGWPVLRLGVGDGQVVSRRGVLVRRTDVVPRHKVQSCGVRQGPLQRRLGLATVAVHLPAGPVHAVGKHREAADARDLALRLARPGVSDGTVPRPLSAT